MVGSLVVEVARYNEQLGNGKQSLGPVLGDHTGTVWSQEGGDCHHGYDANHSLGHRGVGQQEDRPDSVVAVVAAVVASASQGRGRVV